MRPKQNNKSERKIATFCWHGGNQKSFTSYGVSQSQTSFLPRLLQLDVVVHKMALVRLPWRRPDPTRRRVQPISERGCHVRRVRHDADVPQLVVNLQITRGLLQQLTLTLNSSIDDQQTRPGTLPEQVCH